MSFLSGAINRLRAAMGAVAPALRPVERTILEAVANRLEPSARERLEGQIRETNFVQRQLKGREVSLYTLRDGQVKRNPDLRFPHQGDEVKLATVKLVLPSTEKLRAEVYLVRGHVFSIQFEKPPREAGKDSDEATVTDVVIHMDPMMRVLPSDTGVSKEPRSVGLGGVWRDWAARNPGYQAFESLASSDRQQYLSAVEARLPDDYRELLEQTEGVTLGELSILGASEIYRVALEDGDHWVIGQDDGRGYLVLRADNIGIVLYSSIESHETFKIGGSLREALDTLVGGKLELPRKR